jgi:hypothetical protein
LAIPCKPGHSKWKQRKISNYAAKRMLFASQLKQNVIIQLSLGNHKL